jgi:hypothetical protein
VYRGQNLTQTNSHSAQNDSFFQDEKTVKTAINITGETSLISDKI